MFRFLPEQASEFAPKVDNLHHLITDLSVFFTVLIFGAAVYFAIRYRRRNGVDHETPRIEGDHRLEILWTAIPTIICIFIAVPGVQIYHEMRNPPTNTLDIGVTGYQWKWKFEYPNGKTTIDEFTVPVNQPVRLIMRSTDVLHSFFIPVMRVKADVIPNRYTQIWFKPVKTGTFNTFCTEYCGKDHSAMLAKLNVVSEGEYERWINDWSADIRKSKISPAQVGFEVYNKNCTACHSIDGTPRVGPSFKGIFGREAEFADGSKVIADENYIEESIRNPNAKVVKGYPAVMNSFQGLLSDEDIGYLVSFLREVDKFQTQSAAPVAGTPASQTAKDPASMTPEERGQAVYQTKLCIGCHSLDGSKVVGPSFKGIYGRTAKFADGSSATVDDDYIKRSIAEPNAQVVEGFAPGMMPAMGSQLTSGDVDDLIAYLKTVK